MVRPARAALALPAALAAAGQAWAFDGRGGRDPFRDPPPSLPESVNGVVRASRDGARDGRIGRIRDVFPAIRACWRPPGADATGRQMTVRLSFKRNGTLLGRPRITYAALGDDPEERRRFAGSVLDAFESCLPLPFSPSFGAAIAGRPFTFRFLDDRAV